MESAEVAAPWAGSLPHAAPSLHDAGAFRRRLARTADPQDGEEERTRTHRLVFTSLEYRTSSAFAAHGTRAVARKSGFVNTPKADTLEEGCVGGVRGGRAMAGYRALNPLYTILVAWDGGIMVIGIPGVPP